MKLKMKVKAEGTSGEVTSAIRPGMKKVADMISKHAGNGDAPQKKFKLKMKR